MIKQGRRQSRCPRAYEKQAMIARTKLELKSVENTETNIPAPRARAITLRVIIVETPYVRSRHAIVGLLPDDFARPPKRFRGSWDPECQRPRDRSPRPCRKRMSVKVCYGLGPPDFRGSDGPTS
jgi:hypothetical protein